MKVSSSAALATLTVTPKDANDPAIQLVMTLASKLQLSVTEVKKGALTLELPSGQTLSQRNAILRCLGGMGLHMLLMINSWVAIPRHPRPLLITPWPWHP
jgi:hypothetical protein